MTRCWLIIILLLYSCEKDALQHSSLHIYPCINVRDYGAMGNGSASDTKAFELAMDAADSLHLPIFVPNGVYRASIIIQYDGVQIIGEEQPDEYLTKGTTIIGKINCNNKKNINITNLGIDSRGQLQAPGDAAALISGSGVDTTPLHQQFDRISLIGDGYSNYMHGILCQAGTDITIKNIVVSRFFHGIAIRSSNVKIDSIKAISCGFTSIIIKSTEGYNAYTHNISIDHITIDGSSTDAYNRGGLVLIQSYNDTSRTENILVQNVSSNNGGVACVAIEQVKGIVDNVMIKNCSSTNQGDANTRACYDVAGGSNIIFQNCTANNSLGYGYRCTGRIRNVRVINSYERNSGAGSWIGLFSYLQLNGVEIIK